MSRRNFVIEIAEGRRTAHTQPVFVDSITQAIDVLRIYLRKTIDDVEPVLAQGKSNVLGKYPILQTKWLKGHRHGMKGESFQGLVAVGENVHFMAKISQSSGQLHSIPFPTAPFWGEIFSYKCNFHEIMILSGLAGPRGLWHRAWGMEIIRRLRL